MSSNWGADRKPCPVCGGVAECESVDVGVGLILNTAAGFMCYDCGWQEGGPDDFGFIDIDERPFVEGPLDAD